MSVLQTVRAVAAAVALAIGLCRVASAQTPPDPAPVPAAPDAGRPRSPERSGVAPNGASPVQPIALPPPAVTHHTLALNGRTLRFTARAEALRFRDGQGVPQYDLVVTAFSLDGADPRTRPVTFAFNGGPGAASAFLDVGAIGPWRLPIGGAAVAPSAPPILTPNDDTWLDFTDLVFVDPVGTGFSRLVSTNEDLRKRLWSVDGDIESLAATVRRWTVENRRPVSPKFIIGESYGGFRGPRLTRALAVGQGIGVSGMVLLSPALDIARHTDPIDVLGWADTLPSMAAAARERPGSIQATGQGPVERAALADVEAYAGGDFIRDLLLGPRDHDAIARIVDRVAGFTGLDRRLVAQRAGRIDTTTFLRELHRDTGEIGSYYEASELGLDPYPASAFSGHPDLVFDGLRAPLTSAMLDLYGRLLNWLPDLPYELVSQQVARQWDFGRSGGVESVRQLREDLALDRRLRVLIGHGTTDLVTPYFRTQLILNQLPASLVDPDRVRLDVLPGGHMFYARDASRRAFRASAEALYPEN